MSTASLFCHIVFVLLVSVLSVQADAKKLSTTEQQIKKQLDQQMPYALKLLEKSVNINSGTMNFGGVKAVADMYQHEFQSMGVTSQWVDGKAFGRAGHLLAHYGDKGPKILLIGHLDTVFAKNDPFQQYRPLGTDKVAGPGITDMKGGNVIIIEIIRGLKTLGLLDNLQIKVVMTGDEERSGSPLNLSKAAIIDAAKWADIALGFEDGDSNIKTAVVARRGSVNWQLTVSGRPAHSSQIFTSNVGYGAIFETARILDGFRQSLSEFGNLTLNPGILLGGTDTRFDDATAKGTAFGKNNVVSKTTIVNGGIRALTPKELSDAKQIMQQIVSDNLLHTRATLTFGEGYPPMAPTDANYHLLSLYSQISEDLDYGEVIAVNPRNAGAADISFAAEHVEMALDGLGLMGSGGHTKDEVADMTSFPKNMHKAAILLHRIASQTHH